MTIHQPFNIFFKIAKRIPKNQFDPVGLIKIVDGEKTKKNISICFSQFASDEQEQQTLIAKTLTFEVRRELLAKNTHFEWSIPFFYSAVLLFYLAYPGLSEVISVNSQFYQTFRIFFYADGIMCRYVEKQSQLYIFEHAVQCRSPVVFGSTIFFLPDGKWSEGKNILEFESGE